MNETTNRDSDDKDSLTNRVKKKRVRSSHSKKGLTNGKKKNPKDSEPLSRKPRHKASKGASRSTTEDDVTDLTSNTIQEGISELHIDGIDSQDCNYPSSNLKSCSTLSNGFRQCEEVVVESVEELLHLLRHSLGNLEDTFIRDRVTVLKLVDCNLSVLPYELGCLVNLKIINVRQNKLKKLPESIGGLTRLDSLMAEYNCLECLPESLKNLKSLSLLSVNDNVLKSLPNGISELEQLNTLDVSNNMLLTLPDVFKSAETIKRIYAQKNQLRSLPSWLSRAKNLQELHLGENQISAWSEFKTFGKTASNLQMLDLSENKLCKLADSFDGLSELSCLNLGRNPFENQKRPWATGNFLTSLPHTFCQLRKVTLLSLDGNQLKSLPNNFSDLVNLRMINLVQNCLETLPDSFCQLPSLELCLLSRNCLQRLPENFGNLPLLNHLEVSDNKLINLPVTFKNLSKLTYLDLSNNCLVKEPDFLHLLTNLNYLSFHSNPFEHSNGDIVDPELCYAYAEAPTDSVRSGQFEDIEVDQTTADPWTEELDFDNENHDSSSEQTNKVVTLPSTSLELDLPVDTLPSKNPNQLPECVSHSKTRPVEDDDDTDVEWELSHGVYDVNASNYQDQYLFMPSDLHCKIVHHQKPVLLKTFPGQFDDADD